RGRLGRTQSGPGACGRGPGAPAARQQHGRGETEACRGQRPAPDPAAAAPPGPRQPTVPPSPPWYATAPPPLSRQASPPVESAEQAREDGLAPLVTALPALDRAG